MAAVPQEMAGWPKGRLLAKMQESEPALEGRLEPHYRFLLELQPKRVEAVEADSTTLEQQIQQRDRSTKRNIIIAECEVFLPKPE